MHDSTASKHDLLPTGEVLEMARFGLVAGVDPEGVRAEARGVDGWLAEQPGFLTRVLVGPDADGRFTDLVRWRSEADALAAAAAIGSVPELAGFMAMIDPSSIEMRHLPVVASLGPRA